MTDPRRRVWMVVSDADGNPEVGYELRDLTDAEFEIDEGLEWDPLGMPTLLRTSARTITVTLKCEAMTMYRPSADGWEEEQAERPGIRQAPAALPPDGPPR